MGKDLLPEDILRNYEVHEWKHACAILKSDCPQEFQDIIAVLGAFRLLRTEVKAKGGGKSPVAQRLDSAFYDLGWINKTFDTTVQVDDRKMVSPTHEVDCYKKSVALEVEWSNKDPFFDRDLNNFRLLFDLRAVSVGVIVTKSNDLIDVFKNVPMPTPKEPGRTLFDKFGMSTTWMSKLLTRIEGGGGGGCPLLVFGITRELWTED